MASSLKEILEAFQPFINLGLVGFDLEDHTEDRINHHLVYSTPAPFSRVFTPREMTNLPESKTLAEARKMGLVAEEEILAFIESKSSKLAEEAALTGKIVVVENLGLLSCACPDEECSWDTIYEVVTPKGEFLYIREHTW